MFYFVGEWTENLSKSQCFYIEPSAMTIMKAILKFVVILLRLLFEIMKESTDFDRDFLSILTKDV